MSGAKIAALVKAAEIPRTKAELARLANIPHEQAHVYLRRAKDRGLITEVEGRYLAAGDQIDVPVTRKAPAAAREEKPRREPKAKRRPGKGASGRANPSRKARTPARAAQAASPPRLPGPRYVALIEAAATPMRAFALARATGIPEANVTVYTLRAQRAGWLEASIVGGEPADAVTVYRSTQLGRDSAAIVRGLAR